MNVRGRGVDRNLGLMAVFEGVVGLGALVLLWFNVVRPYPHVIGVWRSRVVTSLIVGLAGGCCLLLVWGLRMMYRRGEE